MCGMQHFTLFLSFSSGLFFFPSLSRARACSLVQGGHADLRSAIVQIVLAQNQTLEEQNNFQLYFGVSVAAWSARMQNDFEWGEDFF